MQSSRILSLFWCNKGTNLNWASKYPHSCIAIRGRNCKFPKFRGFLSSWYRVCTKEIFTSKGSFRDAESKNIILGLVQKGYKPLRGFKLPAFMFRQIGPTIQISGILGLPIAMVPYLHQNSTNNKRNLRDAEPKNIILGLLQKGYKPRRGFKLTAFMYRHVGTRMQISVTSGLLIAMVPYLHENNTYIKRKL